MIYLYCPDDNAPNGGIRKIYNHADVLNRNGFEAAVVHLKPGFRCTWFQNDTRVVYAQTVRPLAEDFIVAAEVFGPDIALTAPGIRKVIFNQNCYNTFVHYPLGKEQRQAITDTCWRWNGAGFFHQSRRSGPVCDLHQPRARSQFRPASAHGHSQRASRQNLAR